jgi:hypothetical protein
MEVLVFLQRETNQFDPPVLDTVITRFLYERYYLARSSVRSVFILSNEI